MSLGEKCAFVVAEDTEEDSTDSALTAGSRYMTISFHAHLVFVGLAGAFLYC